MNLPFTNVRLVLIDKWHHAWKFSSIRFLAVGAAIQGAVVTCPAAISDHLPTWIMSGASTVAFICMILSGLGRITTTEKTHEHSDEP